MVDADFTGWPPSRVRDMDFRMFNELTALLQRRLDIIADHAWRDRDPEGHLAAIAGVSGEISDWTATHRARIDARLRHFLENSSFQKALDHVKGLTVENHGD
jgi:hypothetical protein